MTNQNTYYNYIYLDPRKPGKYEYSKLNFCLLYEPFYVGKGKDKRYLDHINEARKEGLIPGNYKNNKIVKILELNYNMKDFILILNFTKDEEYSKTYEIELIKEIGRLDLKEGTLTNLTHGGDGVSGRVLCKDKNGKYISVLKSEFDNRKISGHSKGFVTCKDKDGNTFSVTKEEFDSRDDLFGVSKGDTHKKSSNKNYKGASNSQAKRINIYNHNNILMFECHGNFKKVCKENNLPLGLLRKSYQNNGKKILQTKESKAQANLHKNLLFINWYAKII